MSQDNELQKVIEASACIANSFSFPQDIPSAPNPLRLSKWYASEILTITNQINSIEESLNTPATCKEGCSACCSQLISINKPEYLMIEFATTNLEKEIQTKLKSITNEQCNILEKNGFSSTTLTPLMMSETKQNQLQQLYFSLNLECPFLNDDKACMIYNVRPTLCWSYRNYGNPRDCSTSYNIPTTIKYDDWESRLLKRIYQAKKPPRNSSIIILQFALQHILS